MECVITGKVFLSHKNRNEGKSLNELIFVRRPRGYLWGKTYFAYVVKFVRIVPIGHREFFSQCTRCYFYMFSVHPLSVLCLTTHD